MSVDLKKLTEKFFTDPDWSMMEELILEYIEPMASSMNINTKMSNDEIATEVRGRQLAYESLSKFLEDSKIITRRAIIKKTTFK